MEEVVSVSDLSTLAAGITGGTMAPFSCSTGCSGTGIARVKHKIEKSGYESIIKIVYSITTKMQK